MPEIRRSKQERLDLASIISRRITNGEARADLAKEFNVGQTRMAWWLREVGHYKRDESNTTTVIGHLLSNHPDTCPIVDCFEKSEPPIKTGFKNGSSIGQWKSYCPGHGFVFYNLDVKE